MTYLLSTIVVSGEIDSVAVSDSRLRTCWRIGKARSIRRADMLTIPIVISDVLELTGSVEPLCHDTTIRVPEARQITCEVIAHTGAM